MTRSDPPRFRNEPGLPAALGAALRSSESDGLLPSPQALNELERGLFAALGGTAGLTALGSAARGAKSTALSKLISSKLSIVALHLMLGAAAGVGVMEVGPVYRALTSTASAPTESRPASARISQLQTTRMTLTAQPSGRAAELGSPRALKPMQQSGAALADKHSVSAPRLPPSAQPSTKGASSSELAELSEVDLIERAHRALGSDPQQALTWLKEHERRFPNGTFAQERDAIAIEALVGEGDLVSARARARQFLGRFPGSAYAAHVESLVRANRSHKP